METTGWTFGKRTVVALALLLGGAGCATSGAGEATAEEETEARELPKFVVVPSSAEFASRPADDAETWSHDPGQSWRFRVVSAKGEWLELRPAEAGTAPVLQQIDVTVFAKRDAAEPAPDEPASNPAPASPKERYQLTWVPPGSPLYWPDGSKAGAVRDNKWPVRLELEGRKGRRCFAANLRESVPKNYTPDRYFPICVAEANLSAGSDPQKETTGSKPTKENVVGMLEIAVDIRFNGVDGGVSWSQVKSPVVDRQTAIKSCYGDEVTPQNQFGGKLAVAIQVAPTGEVQSVDLSRSTLPDQTVPSCVRETLKKASFPSVSDGSTIDLEFVFSSSLD
ncbi:MAG: AgmX/PglI C-terminal domain-containing protein, partial [Bradymonadaceae bacterium]